MNRGTEQAFVDSLAEFALSLPAAWPDTPWGDRVTKVGKKIFLFVSGPESERPVVTTKLPESHDYASRTPGVPDPLRARQARLGHDLRRRRAGGGARGAVRLRRGELSRRGHQDAWSSGSTPKSPPNRTEARAEETSCRRCRRRHDGRGMHLADRHALPAPYRARPYRGRYGPCRDGRGVGRLPRVHRQSELAECRAVRRHLRPSGRLRSRHRHRPDRTVDGVQSRWSRTAERVGPISSRASGLRGVRPTHPGPPHAQPLLRLAGRRTRAAHGAVGRTGGPRSFPRLRRPPGPGHAATGEAAWLEALGYERSSGRPALVRPDLDDIPDRPTP